jgi:hypothetical protein
VDEGDREEVIRMAKISVELRSGTARFAVAVQAPTIQQALSVAVTRFPGNPVRVKSSIESALPSTIAPLEWD